MSNMIYANDGTVIACSGNTITCTNGEAYVYGNKMLVGPHGMNQMNVGSIQEAMGIVAGLHGGRKF